MTEPGADACLLRFRDVAVSRGGRPVAANVSFEVSRGEAVILRGPNGAGKTTLLRAAARLLPVDAGVISVGGGDAARPVYCGHGDGVKPALTVMENAQFWARLYRAPADRAQAALAAFDIHPLAGRRAGDLSAGQRRRLALARIIIAEKPVWLLDEPSASMDAASTERLLAVIAAHRAAGGAAVIATHDRTAIAGARAFAIEPAGAAA